MGPSVGQKRRRHLGLRVAPEACVVGAGRRLLRLSPKLCSLGQ